MLTIRDRFRRGLGHASITATLLFIAFICPASYGLVGPFFIIHSIIAPAHTFFEP